MYKRQTLTLTTEMKAAANFGLLLREEELEHPHDSYKDHKVLLALLAEVKDLKTEMRSMREDMGHKRSADVSAYAELIP